MIQVTCPSCTAVLEIDLQYAGRTFQCPMCNAQLRAPSAAVQQEARPGAGSEPEGPLLPQDFAASDSPNSEPPRRQVTASPAIPLQPASEARPAGVSSSRVPPAARRQKKKPRSTVWLGALAVVGLATLGLGAVVLFGLFGLPTFTSSSFSEALGLSSEDSPTPHASNDTPHDRWYEPSDIVRRGQVSIKLDKIYADELYAKDEAGQVFTLAGKHLIVLIEMRNRGVTPVEFRSWHSVDQLFAKLTDDADRDYPLADLSAAPQVKNHVPARMIEANSTLRSMVAFDIPEAAANVKPSTLRLTLSSDAVEADGHIQFEIPAQQVGGF